MHPEVPSQTRPPNRPKTCREFKKGADAAPFFIGDPFQPSVRVRVG